MKKLLGALLLAGVALSSQPVFGQNPRIALLNGRIQTGSNAEKAAYTQELQARLTGSNVKANAIRLKNYCRFHYIKAGLITLSIAGTVYLCYKNADGIWERVKAPSKLMTDVSKLAKGTYDHVLTPIGQAASYVAQRTYNKVLTPTGHFFNRCWNGMIGNGFNTGAELQEQARQLREQALQKGLDMLSGIQNCFKHAKTPAEVKECVEPVLRYAQQCNLPELETRITEAVAWEAQPLFKRALDWFKNPHLKVQ